MSDTSTLLILERKIQDLEFDLRLHARSTALSELKCRRLQEEIEAFKLLYPEEYSATLEQLRKKKETLRVRKRSVL